MIQGLKLAKMNFMDPRGGLNEFYAGVSTMESFNDEIPSNNIASGSLLSNINIHDILQKDVYDLSSKLDASKATGPDNIGNLLLKKCAPN